MAHAIDSSEITEGLCGDCTPPARSSLVGSTINGAVVGAVVFGLAGAAISALTGLDVTDGAVYGGTGGAAVGGLAGFARGMQATQAEHSQVVMERMQQRPSAPINWHRELQSPVSLVSADRMLDEEKAVKQALVSEVAHELLGL